jgi:hypothetical protein
LHFRAIFFFWVPRGDLSHLPRPGAISSKGRSLDFQGQVAHLQGAGHISNGHAIPPRDTPSTSKGRSLDFQRQVAQLPRAGRPTSKGRSLDFQGQVHISKGQAIPPRATPISPRGTPSSSRGTSRSPRRGQIFQGQVHISKGHPLDFQGQSAVRGGRAQTYRRGRMRDFEPSGTVPCLFSSFLQPFSFLANFRCFKWSDLRTFVSPFVWLFFS